MACALAGLATYLWPAIAAPVVLWSDSRFDLDWARAGQGIVSPVWVFGHPAKPGYLLFLKLALAATGGSERGIVIFQSVLLWGSIAATAAFIGRHRGPRLALAYYGLAILFLRLRDTASAIMTEALAVALLVPLAALVLDPPRSRRGIAAVGALTGALFLVRPNLGAVALVLLASSVAVSRRWRSLLPFFGVFLATVAPFWIATRPPPSGDASRGLTFSIFQASGDDHWPPALDEVSQGGTPADVSAQLLSKAQANWRRTLAGQGPDARRQLIWRALHGLLGSEFYDARWSATYRSADFAAKIASPFAILLAAALLVARPFARSGDWSWAAGAALFVVAVVQDLVLGSYPRLVLPLIPALLLFAVVAFPSVVQSSRAMAVAGVVFLLSIVGVWVSRSPLGMEWGMVEKSGVCIEQPIARGTLPRMAPATLHIRIAPPVVPTSAGLRVFDDRSQLLYSSDRDPSRRRAEISIPLSQALLDRNHREAVILRLEGFGLFDSVNYLMFPVIPPPWSLAASREGSSELSPSTSLPEGSLDWWAHAGVDSRSDAPQVKLPASTGESLIR